MSGLDSIFSEGIPEKANGKVGIAGLECPSAHDHATIDVDNNICVVEPACVNVGVQIDDSSGSYIIGFLRTVSG